MASPGSPGSQHCAKCIGTLSFHIESHLGLLKYNSGDQYFVSHVNVNVNR